MIYSIFLKFMFQTIKSNLYETRSEKRVINGGMGREPPSGGVVGFVMCKLKTNAGVY